MGPFLPTSDIRPGTKTLLNKNIYFFNVRKKREKESGEGKERETETEKEGRKWGGEPYADEQES